MAPSSSLQIPDSPAGPSRQQYPSSSATSRPVSVNVHSTNPAPVSPTPASRKQRASHTVVSSTSQQQSHNSSSGHHASHSNGEDATPYPDIYSHPAAMAYAAAHPRRTIPKFGPYLLLQTLGEGEFGKVKLGLHSQWGEEVAVKLMRRGNVDSAVRMSKVEREIEVLRTLKHPNIVRLYDVIETDKYIGIIIEYASGGELFDHILAHRYLREKDAAKLFSQLISGVWYIHQKKIVHRDLKLENLLLDKHRNVIITDFGFANRFEHRSDDLMQTSCGSPCYAAPELVISEGLYVGSAVDIWSCGVILYAMLAGYLPFDDDPANPDGDNINLLYKYIVNTPLSFPEYVSEQARDILSLMLVPDPRRRASLESVMRHPWLAAYVVPPASHSNPAPMAFGRTVEELERTAMEQHQQKRLAYQKQMKASQAGSPSASTPDRAARSQSHRPDAASHSYRNGGAATSPSSTSRSQTTQPDLFYETSMDQSVSMSPPPASAPVPGSAGKRSVYNADVDDPFAAPDGYSGLVTSPVVDHSMQVDSGSKPTGRKPGSAGGQRHTIQVEYDEPRQGRAGAKRDRESQGEETPKEKRRRSRDRSRGPSGQTPTPATSPVNGHSPEKRRASQASMTMKPLPPSPPGVGSPSPSSFRDRPDRSPVKSSTPSRSNSVPIPVNTQVADPPSITLVSPPDTPIAFAAPEGAQDMDVDLPEVVGKTGKEKDTGSASSKSSKHKRGLSSVGGLTKIFSNTPSEVNGTSNTSGSLLSPGPGSEKETNAGTTGTSGKKSRRNTLTVMVEPIRSTIMKTKGRMASTPLAGQESGMDTGISEKRAISSQPPRSAVEPTTRTGRMTPSYMNTSGTDISADADSGAGARLPASTNKARGVMQWFRTKSKGRESVTVIDAPQPSAAQSDEDDRMHGTPTPTKYSKKNATSSSTINQASSPKEIASPTPILLSPNTSSSSKHPQRTPSSATDASSVTPSFVSRFRNSVTVGGGSSNATSQAKATQAKGPGGALRIHHGAVDQDTITTRPPPEVMKHIKEVLLAMGVEVQIESDFKYRCIRVKRRKGAVTGLGSVGPGGNSGVAAFTMVGSAASNGVDKRGLPLPSSSFTGTGGMLRGLLMRRQSSQVSSSGMGSTSFDDDSPNVSVVSGEPGLEPVYGDQAEDVGDEVRFSVELTRLDRLNDTYSLDIRRLKGNLRSYKFLYDTIRQRADLR